ncbi:MAG TPA: hypothetical protein VFZ34_20655, partial [Blastocatellia bacterium]|nr:hypothetical protein [Blastocatellia bacterium]
MPNFKDLQSQLQQARANHEQARADLQAARERVKRIAAEIARHNRVYNPQDGLHRERRQELERQKRQADAIVQRQSELYAHAVELERGRFVDFAVFTDPRERIKECSNHFPFLMLPVRLETRFKTINADGRVRAQLWVRVYPDDCAVDSFAATLSESEINGARLFWTEMWKAAGIEDQQRGAWRGLVSNFGTGRAAWITQQYRPLNDAPSKAKSEDIVLVVPTDAPLSDDEMDAAALYWPAVWLADGDQAKEAEARAVLEQALGEAGVVKINEHYRPVNLSQPPVAPLTKAETKVTVATVVFPKPDDIAAKQLSWSQAAQVNVLPDRFVLIGYQNNQQVFEVLGQPIHTPLQVGPDPSAAPDEQLRQENGSIVVSDEMLWMTDFDRAVAWGMGFRIDLTEGQWRAGFDRLLVLGVRLSADEEAGKTLVESLLDHHYHSRNGFSLLPQGTPTNNTESGNVEAGSSGFSRSEDPDESFDYYFKQQAQFELTNDWFAKRDGQWLAEWLGIDAAVLQKVQHANGRDQLEACAMNVALWPATFGYFMETMMHPVFDDDDVEATRWFFTHFVRGRGTLPSLRIGAQPYGILPTTAFSRLGQDTSWLSRRGLRPIPGIEAPRQLLPFMLRLHETLQKLDAEWRGMETKVSFVGKPGDAHKTLLDIVGLHAGSVEYYQRYAESLQQLFNRLNLGGLGGALVAALLASGYYNIGLQALRDLGYAGEQLPDILEKFFLTAQNLLRGPVVDDRPLSETEPIRAYTDDNRNYIHWLRDAARTSLETLRQQQGFSSNKVPNALLYLMLRHALMEGYWDTDLRLRLAAGVVDEATMKTIRREPAFVHVKASTPNNPVASESRLKNLYSADTRITGNPTQLVHQYIPSAIGKHFAARYLTQQLAALERLQDTPTARLERLLAEHIDCCTYRLDAWQSGLLNYQLATMRYRGATTDMTLQQGLYLGAYGWLEDVRPENKQLTPVRLDAKLDKIFNADPQQPPLVRDNTNAGYIHAPSLNHAVTAAVLRNGYLSNATPANPNTLAVNLSSERVRRALAILEGIRGGQSLGALLGYQFERGLHDRHNLPAGAEVDEFIFNLRKEFPLRAGRIKSTKDDNAAIDTIEARNVIDGLRLINHIKKTGQKTYPFGKPLPNASPTQAKAINDEVDRLLDLHDAVADLALAEGVHQAVQGNFDRVAATLETYSKGNHPPQPEVVQTPRSGATLTHRVGLHLEAGLNANVSPVPGVAVTPRALAEPAVNKWLAAMLPAPSEVGCLVQFFDPAANGGAGATVTREVTQTDLQLQPLDLLYLVQTDSQQAMTELDDRILRFVTETFAPLPDRPITIQYTARLASGNISFFELSPHLASLRALTLRARPLCATDVALHQETEQQQDAAVFIDKTRLVAVKNSLAALHPQLVNFQAAISALFTNLEAIRQQIEDLQVDPVANEAQLAALQLDLTNQRNDILAHMDDYVAQTATLLAAASMFALPQTGWGFAYEAKRQAFTDVRKNVDELIERWNDRLAEYDQLINDYNNLPAATEDQVRIDLLRQAERLIATQPVELVAPFTPADLKLALDGKRTLFTNKRDEFSNILASHNPSLVTLLNAVRTALPVTAFDTTEFTLNATEQRLLTFAADVVKVVQTVGNDIDRRLKAAEEKFTAHDTAAQATARVEALRAAAQLLLGDDFLLVPEFSVSSAQGDEWENALAASHTLLSYLQTDLQQDFPVDDWLYGIARVREKMRYWEQATVFAEGFGKAEVPLTPMQLPFQADDRWLALQFPADRHPDSERLLYTAHYAVPFQKGVRQCGLLLDEWTEVIPAAQETTGITFHYDRPNSEPPQTMLLVTAPRSAGPWDWSDLVAALNETLDWAKRRAVEPVHVDDSPLARFLPATISAVTLY